MKITPGEMKDAEKEPLKPKARQRYRQADPSGDYATANRLGFNRSTWRNRMKAVKAGKMTMEEARTRPIQSRIQCGKRAAKARWGGNK